MKMNCLKRQLIYLVLVFNLTIIYSAKSQDVATLFDLATVLKNEGNYEAALKLYQRISFFGDGYKSTDCLLNTADAYFVLNDFAQAKEFYELAYFSTSNDSIRNLIALSKAAIFIYEKKFLEALQELYSTNDDLNISMTKNIFLATAYYGLNKFEESKSAFNEVISDSVKKNQLIKLIAKAERVQKKNPKTARVLSMIIPGMGQFYAGDIKNGINSLLITGAFFYLTINTALQYSFLEATSVLPWFSRYYIGGYNRAQTITINRIEEKQFRLFQQIMKIVSAN